MQALTECGAPDHRSSALWGRGGGRGGRGAVLAVASALILAYPVAATAAATAPPVRPAGTYVAPDLLAKAQNSPGAKIDVIVRSTGGATSADNAARGLGPLSSVTRRLELVNGVAATLPARLVEKLAKLPGLSVTPDAPVKLDGFSSGQLWPYASGAASLWSGFVKPATIAIVDSGIDAGRADFGSRVVANVNLSHLAGNTVGGDGRGHGTFVAGIAAGGGVGYAGAAPNADIVALDVMDDQGMALTSDVIAACAWILQHKDQYGIKVANFSLHSTYPSNFGRDPLDAAVEKLWFGGVTVVAAAGNYGNTDGTPSGVRYAPGNDPFVITVGALDLGSSSYRYDDSMAPWSAYGYTYDGFWKPDVAAPGRYMIGPVPPSSTLPQQRPDRVTAPGYMELSGTSFAAPVVSGTAAVLLARHPGWGPDQVKGALMQSARPVPLAKPYQGGVGEIGAYRANSVVFPPNPDRALERYLKADPAGGSVPVFDAVSWYDAASSDVSWDSVSWDSVSWDSVSWDSVSWDSVSWDSVSWADVSWSDVSWSDVSWSDSAKEDAVADEPGAPALVDPATADALLESIPSDTGS